jgi:hypothetical protein
MEERHEWWIRYSREALPAVRNRAHRAARSRAAFLFQLPAGVGAAPALVATGSELVVT